MLREWDLTWQEPSAPAMQQHSSGRCTIETQMQLQAYRPIYQVGKQSSFLIRFHCLDRMEPNAARGWPD